MSAAEPPPIEVLDRNARSGRLTLLARLAAAPFPFEEPGFFQADPLAIGVAGDRRRTVAGNTYGEHAHYRDDRVLIHLPPSFDPARPCRILLYFHGHGTELRRDVVAGHGIPAQVDRSGSNTVLVAPQLARGAADSHSGKLSHPRGAARLLAEVAALLKKEFSVVAEPLSAAPVVVAAFSGGFRAAADCLAKGGLDGRIAGCVLIDALYGRLDDFVAWREAEGSSTFLVALHGPSTRDLTLTLGRRLRAAGQTVQRRWPREFAPGMVALARSAVPHPDMPVLGPPRWPVTQVLRRWPLPGTAT